VAKGAGKVVETAGEGFAEVVKDCIHKSFMVEMAQKKATNVSRLWKSALKSWRRVPIRRVEWKNYRR